MALPAVVSAAVDIAWIHCVARPTDAARTLDLLHKKTMYKPAEEAKVAAEKMLGVRIWDYPTQALSR